jgi:hypothetical protein
MQSLFLSIFDKHFIKIKSGKLKKLKKREKRKTKKEK